MDFIRRRPKLALLLALLAACASAQDRLEQGVQLQAQGRYFEAAYRYIDALDKDRSMTEARDRLLEVADSAVDVALRSSGQLTGQGEHVPAAEWFEDVDALVGAARRVGVQIPTPAEYGDLRRGAFDRAVEALIEHAGELRLRGQWVDARRTLVRARGQFEPSAEQKERSLQAELDLLLDWAGAELEARRYRAAYARAREALELRVPADGDVVATVEDIQARALELGTVVTAVLPVTSTGQVHETVGPDFEIQLSDDLELDYWRLPPPFVGIVDPVVVRREVRYVQRAGRPLSTYEITEVLSRVGAEMGVLIEFSSVTITEADVRASSRQSRTRDGRVTSYMIEQGSLAYEGALEVVIIDARGREIRGNTFRVQERGPFERGVYEGDWRELDLSRNELRLFDPDVHAEQFAAVERALLAALVPAVADRVFSAVLSQVP